MRVGQRAKAVVPTTGSIARLVLALLIVFQVDAGGAASAHHRRGGESQLRAHRDRESIRACAGHARRDGVWRLGHVDAPDSGRRAVRDVPGRRRGISESAYCGGTDARCRCGVRGRPPGDLRAQRLAARGGRAARGPVSTRESRRRDPVRDRQSRRRAIRSCCRSGAQEAGSVGCAAIEARPRRQHHAGRAVCDDGKCRRRAHRVLAGAESWVSRSRYRTP